RAGRRVLLAIGIALVPIGLTAVQPDLSTAMLLSALTLAMLVLARIPWRILLPLLVGAALAAPLAVDVLRPYQLERLHAFLSGSVSNGTPGFTVLQAHVALASGGLLGMRNDPRYPVLSEYLPGRQNDLALASLVETYGLIAGAVAVVAALILVWRLALASRGPRTRHGSLVAAGLAALFTAEIVVPVGGNLGLLPIAGVPFPLLGLGGTAAAVHLAALGVVLAVRRDGARHRLWSMPRWRNPRPRLLRAGALAATCVLVVFSAYGWQLHAVDGATLRAVGDVQMSRCIRIPADRGMIADRHGTPLVYAEPDRQVVAVPAFLLQAPDGVARLAQLTRQPVAKLRSTVEAARAQLSVKLGTVPAAVAGRVEASGIPGVFTVPSPRRVHPQGSLLAAVLGFVGVATPQEEARWPGLPLGETVGRAGIERQYDAILRGIDGKQCMNVHPSGVPVSMAERQDPVPGADLLLTIDLRLQRKLTSELTARMRASHGDLGGAVVMDPRSGQVLAMASLPSYDPGIYGPPVDGRALARAGARPSSPTLEHVTQVNAPPGSVFKLVVAATNSVYKGISPKTVIPTGGSFTYGGHTFSNWSTFGPQNLTQAIAWSNDVYFYKLALRLGADHIHTVGTALGVGQPTGIDLPGESSGYFGTPASVERSGGTWYGGSTVILGIGQGYLTVTPLQAARWTAGIATGAMVVPRLGLAFGTRDGGYTRLPTPAPDPLSFASQLGPVRAGMRASATYGTGAGLRALPVQAGGKTGSSEDPASPNGKPDSWFTSAAPLNHPEVVATSFVRGGGHGATTSGPVVVATLQQFFADPAAVMSTPPLAPVPATRP
ncbi:MAG TPA: penicillin-binding transpeptidase domain-containing protein, partial [Candidatus Eisenbacteria bacterium]|nr:penicillin-binding transpeptidase domain-containing protein [Candidatus Eisenbacteria bacterium]